MSIQQIGSQFDSFSNMLPHSITTNRFNKIIRRNLESIERVFALDIVDIRILTDWFGFSPPLDWIEFDNPNYLLENALYTRGKPPTGRAETIAWISNMYIARHVLMSLGNYVSALIPRIEFALLDFRMRRRTGLYKIMNEFIGCCENISEVAQEYTKNLHQVEISISGVRGATQLSYRLREYIRSGITECLLKTTYGKDLVYPSIRTYTEFPALEDMGIQIRHKINRKRKKNKINDIRFTRKISTRDIFDLLRKICEADSDQIDILHRIYDWGSGSVHLGQHIPLALSWYSLRWLDNNSDFRSQKMGLHYKDVKKIFDELKSASKIVEYSGKDTYVNSIYDRYILPRM